MYVYMCVYVCIHIYVYVYGIHIYEVCTYMEYIQYMCNMHYIYSI